MNGDGLLIFTYEYGFGGGEAVATVLGLCDEILLKIYAVLLREYFMVSQVEQTW